MTLFAELVKTTKLQQLQRKCYTRRELKRCFAGLQVGLATPRQLFYLPYNNCNAIAGVWFAVAIRVAAACCKI